MRDEKEMEEKKELREKEIKRNMVREKERKAPLERK